MEMVTQEIFVFLALFLYFGIHSTPMDVNMAYSSLDNVQTFLGFPVGSASKESACNAGDLGSIPGLGRSAGEGNSYPLQYSGLENSLDYTVHGITKSQTRTGDFHFHFAEA